MLATGRAKDYFRVGMFLEQGSVDMRSLSAVLRRHGLTQKWKENEHRFKPEQGSIRRAGARLEPTLHRRPLQFPHNPEAGRS